MLKSLSKIGCLLVAAASVGSLTVQTASADEIRSCSAPHTDAAVLYAAPPEYPSIALLQQASGNAWVQVNLTPTGAVAGATIAQSSGNGFLDGAAIKAAQASTFQPEMRDCRPVAGSYLFVVSFER